MGLPNKRRKNKHAAITLLYNAGRNESYRKIAVTHELLRPNIEILNRTDARIICFSLTLPGNNDAERGATAHFRMLDEYLSVVIVLDDALGQ